MRLRDLDARFLGKADATGHWYLDSVEGAQGIMFQCPKCAAGGPVEEEEQDGKVRRFVRGAHYVICWFRNPRNAPRVPDDLDPKPGRWNFTGESIDDITFVGPEMTSVWIQGGCGWHGYVKNGDAT